MHRDKKRIRSLDDVICDDESCKDNSLPTMYLGMPLGAKSRAMSNWNSLIEKCEKLIR